MYAGTKNMLDIVDKNLDKQKFSTVVAYNGIHYYAPNHACF